MKLKSNLKSLLARLSLIPIVALLVFASGPSPVCAQELATTNANPVSASDGSSTVPTGNPQTFFSTVGNYLTSSNPNLPIRGQAEIGLGLAYQSGVNIASDLSARYKISVSTNSGVLLESVTRNAGVNGVIVSEQAGFGYYYIPSTTPDIELSAGLLGGYRIDTRSAAFTAYLDARKSLTANTFAGVRIGFEYDGSGSPDAPVITAYTGFTF
jgi:hypothetical protein